MARFEGRRTAGRGAVVILGRAIGLGPVHGERTRDAQGDLRPAIELTAMETSEAEDTVNVIGADVMPAMVAVMLLVPVVTEVGAAIGAGGIADRRHGGRGRVPADLGAQILGRLVGVGAGCGELLHRPRAR